ncbi:MAG: flagellin [Rickettsiales bacterium]
MANVNASSLISTANASASSSRTAASLARIASGRRIAQAADDVSGLSIGTALQTQTAGLRAAIGNSNQASSLLQVTGGSLTQQISILQRQQSLAIQASSGQLTDANRAALNQEAQGLTAQLDQIAGSTNFNGVALLGGGNLSFTVGTSATDTLSVNLPTTDSATLFSGTAPDLSSAASAQASLANIDAALSSLTAAQANIGATQSRLNSGSAALGSALQQQSAAASSLLDTDVASESTRLATLLVQQSAETATRAQANKLSRGVLQLLQ